MAETEERPRRAEHLGPARRRPQILDAALDIAIDDGVDAVTIAAVARRMHVTRPVVYACFTDRKALIDGLLRREEDHLRDAVLDALTPRKVYADTAVFIDGFTALLRSVAARPQAWMLLYSSPDSEVADLFGRGRATALAKCTAMLRPTLAAWEVPDHERKLPALVELWVSSGEAAVRTLLARKDTEDAVVELGNLFGAAVYHALRSA
ncbi:TetR/AcrR family transcriptional regulator [Tsukamurella sp. 8F]|uniref:TetR/AcrR family transcriptional regulator n=1 Tax=unclassified Tsukamurella TaxID=2633480 RepID=UPI0023B88CAF|nr:MULTISPECIES: TetR/AcrR family transcriptional regulator [unclassified Tsukamurella]MDF0528902.1 TetR/AcrR family transcriptional regulator [Tsukamurella sp. 8J]MDF0586737.1 TetR/AcrR family transcriptional regulator [Tsukamurella sp. 8F]